MKTRFLGVLIWLLFFGFILVGGLGLNLTKVEAQVLPTVPTVQFTTITTGNSEKIASPKIDVALSEVATTDVIVNYQILPTSTAISGQDYILTGNNLTIPAGELSESIPLKILDDKLFSADKTLNFELSSVSSANAVLSSDTTKLDLTYTIIEDNTPTTILTKDPSAALGQNGYFKVAPEITLLADRVATTYYQWDGYRSGGWSTYTDSFKALEGDHTLYYYSDDGNGFPEALQSETFKVDTQSPAIPIVNIIVNDNGKVQLSWQIIPDAANFQIFRDGIKIATLSGSATNFDDLIATDGTIYSYFVVVFDQAGNMVQSQILTAKVVIITTPTVVSENPKVTEIKPAVVKSISTGASTSVSQVTPEPVVTPEVQGEAQVINTPNNAESKPEESRNWNKLLLIISILIIAAGVATGGYYGYEWYMNRKDEEVGDNKSKNKSRW